MATKEWLILGVGNIRSRAKSGSPTKLSSPWRIIKPHKHCAKKYLSDFLYEISLNVLLTWDLSDSDSNDF